MRPSDTAWHGILALVILGLLAPAVRADPPAQPAINVVILDHRDPEVPADEPVKRNAWLDWGERLPHFLPALDDVAAFKRAETGSETKGASLFALNISEDLQEADLVAILTQELEAIASSTGRPSCIIARSTSGNDQMTLVFQDSRDYPPPVAAELILRLGDTAPPGVVELFSNQVGPLCPPPTVVPDRRPGGDGSDKSGRRRTLMRWGLLEDTYLLPQYVLHHVGVLNQLSRREAGTFYLASVPEPGAILATGKTDVYFGVAGIRSPDGGDVRRLLEARTGVEPILIKESDLRARGLDPSSPSFTTEMAAFASMHARTATAEGRDLAMVFVPDLDMPISEFAADYSWPGRSRWKDSVDFGSKTLDAVWTGVKSVLPDARSSCVSHSAGVDIFGATSEMTPDYVGLIKGRSDISPGSRLYGTLSRLTADYGTKVDIITSTADYPALLDHVAVKSAAADFASKTPGVRALHDTDLHGAILPIPGVGHGFGPLICEPTHFEVTTSAGKGHIVSSLLDLGSDASGVTPGGIPHTEPVLECPGGILFSTGAEYRIDPDGGVAELAQKAMAASEAGSFQEGDETYAVRGFSLPGEPAVQAPSPSLIGKANLCETTHLGSPVGALPLAHFRAIQSSDQEQPVGSGGLQRAPCHLAWSDSTMFEPVATRSGHKIPSALALYETESGTEHHYYLSSDAAYLGSADTLYYRSERSAFSPVVGVTKDGTFVAWLANGTGMLYDRKGALRGFSDRHGRAVDLSRSESRDIVSQCASDGRRDDYIYDAGRLSEIRLRGRKRLLCTYDELGRLSSTWSLAGERRYSYAEGGALSGVEDESGGQLISLKYDGAGRVSDIVSGSRKTTIAYDRENGRVTVTQQGASPVEWQLDPQGRPLGVFSGTEGLLFTRDIQGRLIQVAIGEYVERGGSREFRPGKILGAEATSDTYTSH